MFRLSHVLPLFVLLMPAANAKEVFCTKLNIEEVTPIHPEISNTSRECRVENQKILEPGVTVASSDDNIKVFSIRNSGDVKFLPEQVGAKFPELFYFEVTRCSVENVEEKHFENMSVLIILSLTFNFIQSLPGEPFKHLKQLNHLSLMSNQIVHLSNSVFGTLSNLNVLLLSRNDIKSIDADAFNRLSRLIYLDLDHNRIRRLDKKLLWNLVDLRTFTASSNQLETLSECFFAFNKKLERVFLSDNNIISLSVQLFMSQQHLKEVGLVENFCIDSNFTADSNESANSFATMRQTMMENCRANHPPGLSKESLVILLIAIGLNILLLGLGFSIRKFLASP